MPSGSSPVKEALEAYVAGRVKAERLVVAVAAEYYRDTLNGKREMLRPLIDVIHLASRHYVLDPFAVPQLRFTLTTTPASAPATPSPVFRPPPPDRRAARSHRGSDRRDAWPGISSPPARTAWRAAAASYATTAARPPRASAPARTNRWRRRAPRRSPP